MTKADKKAIIDKEYFAYHSSLGGVELKEIQYGIDDRIVFVVGAWSGKPRVHRSKVYYSANGRDYIRCYGYRIYFDECIRRGW